MGLGDDGCVGEKERAGRNARVGHHGSLVWKALPKVHHRRPLFASPSPKLRRTNTQPLAPFLACIGGLVARSRKISSENKFSVLLLHEACSIPLPLPSAGTAPATLDQSVWRSIVMI